MSLIFTDGFDDGLQVAKWNLAFGSSASVQTGGRNGSRLRCLDNSNSIAKTKFSSTDEHATITVGFAFQGGDVSAFDNASSTKGQITLCSDSGVTEHITLLLAGGTTNVAPRMDVFRGDTSGTLLSSVAVSPWVANQWYYVEIQATLSDTVGAVTTKLNGTTVNNISGVDTKNAGTKTVFDSFYIRNARGFSNGTGTAYFDDLYATNGAGTANNTFLGDVAIETLLPNAVGTNSQFTNDLGNSTNNFSHVNEATPDTTTWVQDLTVGQEDTYGFANLVRTAGTVFGVRATAYAQAQDSGPRSMKNVCLSSATTAVGATRTVTTTYTALSDSFEVDPATSAAWTIAGINAAEFGVQVA